MCCFPETTLPNLRQTRDFKISLITTKITYLHFTLKKEQIWTFWWHKENKMKIHYFSQFLSKCIIVTDLLKMYYQAK